MSTQSAFDLGEPRQNGFEFPVTLAERYQPKIQDFIGLTEPKRVITSLLKRPKPCALLFVGPPGSGKTTFGLAFARQLPGSLVHTGAQKTDVAQVDSLWDRFAYMPAVGRWWISLIDEMDQATDKAQLQLLSKLDGTAALRPLWGGGMVKGEAPPVVWIFTSNGIGPDQIKPPLSLLPRFQSRCMILPFQAPDRAELGRYLQKIWKREGGRAGLPLDYFCDLAEGVGVRDALMRVDVELLRNPTIKEVRDKLADKAKRISERTNEEAAKWTAATEIDNDPEVRQAIAAHAEAVDRGMPAATIAAKKAWITIKRQSAQERAS